MKKTTSSKNIFDVCLYQSILFLQKKAATKQYLTINQ